MLVSFLLQFPCLSSVISQMRQYIRHYQYFTHFYYFISFPLSFSPNLNSICGEVSSDRFNLWIIFGAAMVEMMLFGTETLIFTADFWIVKGPRAVWRSLSWLEREFYLFNLSLLIRPARFGFSRWKEEHSSLWWEREIIHS